MVVLRLFEKNLPDLCRDNIKKQRTAAAEIGIKGVEDSISTKDYDSLISIWVPAIHRFADVYKYSNEELNKVINLLYGCLQESDLSLDGLQVILALLNRLLKFKRKLTIQIDWKVLFSLYLSLKSTKYLLYNKSQISGIFSELVTTIRRSRKYFSLDSVSEIIEKFTKMVSPGGETSDALVYLCNMLPSKSELQYDYVPMLISLIRSMPRNLNLVINILSCIGTTSKHNPSIDWTNYLAEIYNLTLPSLPLLSQSLPRPKTYYIELSKTSMFTQKFLAKSSSFAKIVAYTLSKNNFYLLEQWLQNMRSTIKEGKMISSGYINYISRIVINYCKRLRLSNEQKIPEVPLELTEMLVDLVIPYVSLIFHSGHLGQIDTLCANLSYLSPNKVIPLLIEKCFFILEDSNIPHLDAIVVLQRIARPMLEPSVYESGLSHLSVVLNVTLQELTGSDILKSCKVLDLYGQIASLVSLDHSIQGVSTWAQDFFKNLLLVLSELEEVTENKQEKSRDYKIQETLENNLFIIISCISVDIFQIWVDDYFEFISRNNCNNAKIEFGIVTRCLALRNPEKIIKTLLKLTETSLDKSENQLSWRISLLIDSLYYGNNFLLTIADSLELLITKLDDKVLDLAGDLWSSLLNGLLGIYPLSYSPVLPSTIEKFMDQNVVRGKIGNQTSELDLEIQWKALSPDCTSLANRVIEKYLLSPPRDKNDAKKYFKIALPIIKTFYRFQVVFQSNLGCIPVPNGNQDLGILDYEENVYKIIKTIDSMSFIHEDSSLLESFVNFISSAIQNEEYSLFELKKSQILLNDLKKKNINPLIPLKSKNLNESRSFLIMKTHNHYKMLIASSLSQKTYSDSYNYFIHILLKLALHPYKQIRTKSIESIEFVLKSSFINQKNIIKGLWTEIGNSLVFDDTEKLKIQLELLVSKGVLWSRDTVNSDFTVIDLLKKTHNIPDIELQTLIFNCFCNFSISCLPNCSIKNGKISITGSSSIADKILELAQDSTEYHWRSKLYICAYILINMSSLPPNALDEVKKYASGILLDENIDIRESGVILSTSLMYNHIRHHLSNETEEIELTSYTQEGRYLDLDHLDAIKSYKVYHGWTSIKDSIKVRRHGSPESTDAFYLFLTDPYKAKQFIEFSSISHMLESEENIVKNPRPRGTENLNYAIKFLNNPYKFLSSILAPKNRYSRKNLEFSVAKANMIKLFGKAYGPDSLIVMSEVCKEYIIKEKSYQLSALEIFAGIGSASKYWNNDLLFISLLEYSLKESSLHGTGSWVSAFDFICKNQTPGRLVGIFNAMTSYIPTLPSKKLGKLLKILGKVIEKLSWKGVRLYPKLFEALKSLQHDNFADLRVSISTVVSRVINSTSFISADVHAGLYNSYEVFKGLYLIHYTPALDYIEFIQSDGTNLSVQLVLDIISKIYHEIDIDYAVVPFLVKVLPLILTLLRNSDIKIVTGASETLKAVSALRCSDMIYSHLLGFITAQGVSESKVQELIKGLFITMLWYYNQFITVPPVEYFNQLTSSSLVEIRQTGRYYLSMVWRIATNYKKLEEFKVAKDMIATDKNTAVFRLSALILAQHEFVEPWKGQALTALCKMKRHGGEIAQCVNTTLADFWKNHKAWWKAYMNYSQYFTLEELETIESYHSDHSYFA